MTVNGSNIQPNFEEKFNFAKKCFKNGYALHAFNIFNICLNETDDPLKRLHLHNWLGQCSYALKLEDLSKSHFRAAVEIGEKSEKGKLLTAFCHNWLGQYSLGIQLTEEVLENNPQCMDAYQTQLKIYRSMKEEAKAKEVETKILKIHQQNYEKKMLEVLPNNTSVVSYEDFLVPARDNERVKEVLLNNGFLDLAIGDYKTALEEFKELLVMTPENTKALAGAGCCCLELGKISEAKLYVKKALDLDPECEEALKVQNKLG